MMELLSGEEACCLDFVEVSEEVGLGNIERCLFALTSGRLVGVDLDSALSLGLWSLVLKRNLMLFRKFFLSVDFQA